MLSNKTKAQQYKAAMALTDEGLVDARIEVLESLLSDPHCEVTKGALNAIVSVMADRFELLLANDEIVNARIAKMELKTPSGFHKGVDRDGNAGVFEDYEQSIGE